MAMKMNNMFSRCWFVFILLLISNIVECFIPRVSRVFSQPLRKRIEHNQLKMSEIEVTNKIFEPSDNVLHSDINVEPMSTEQVDEVGLMTEKVEEETNAADITTSADIATAPDASAADTTTDASTTVDTTTADTTATDASTTAADTTAAATVDTTSGDTADAATTPDASAATVDTTSADTSGVATTPDASTSVDATTTSDTDTTTSDTDTSVVGTAAPTDDKPASDDVSFNFDDMLSSELEKSSTNIKDYSPSRSSHTADYIPDASQQRPPVRSIRTIQPNYRTVQPPQQPIHTLNPNDTHYISCVKCRAIYEIDCITDIKLGRKVTCGLCQHDWYQSMSKINTVRRL